MRKLPAVIHVLQNTQNLEISCCCFAEDRRERNVQRFITHVHSHCSALWTFCLVAFSLPLASWLAPGLFSVPVPSRPVPSFKLKYDRNKVLTNLDDSKWFIVTTDHKSANGFRDTTETTRRVKILFFEYKFYRRDTCVQCLKPKTACLCCLSNATGKFWAGFSFSGFFPFFARNNGREL